MMDLEAWLEASEEDPSSEHFRIEDDAMAEWAMKKYRRAARQRAENGRLAALEIERIERWQEQADASLERDLRFFEGLLREYAIRCRDNLEDGRKTISLPSGRVQTRPASLKWTVNADAFLPWARANRQDLIRVKEEPALSAIKEAFADGPGIDSTGVAMTEDGEVVPGVEVWRPDYPSVTIKPDID